eukprot:scaffold8558_cov72-Skeletonema_dohrnii-CCMP3373.AAC.1
MFICTNLTSFIFKSLPPLINSTEAEDTEAVEEDTEAEEDTIKEAMVEEEAITTDRAVEADTAEEEIVTKAEDTKLFEGSVKRRRGACIKRNEVPEDVMQKKAALLIALALYDPTNAVT